MKSVGGGEEFGRLVLALAAFALHCERGRARSAALRGTRPLESITVSTRPGQTPRRALVRTWFVVQRAQRALDGLARPDDRGEQQRTLLLLDVREHRERGPVTPLQCVQLSRRQLCEVGQHDPERELVASSQVESRPVARATRAPWPSEQPPAPNTHTSFYDAPNGEGGVIGSWSPAGPRPVTGRPRPALYMPSP
jgi:hypothetical protein